MLIRLLLAAAAFGPLAAPATARPTQEQCDGAAVMSSEINEALIVCGSFPEAVTNSTAVALAVMAATCPVSDWNVMGPGGQLAFLRNVEAFGAKRACDAFISQLVNLTGLAAKARAPALVLGNVPNPVTI